MLAGKSRTKTNRSLEVGTLAKDNARVYQRGEKRPRGEFQLSTFSVLNALQIGAIVALMWHVVNHTLPSLPIIVTAVAMYVLTTLGVTLSYHRELTHEGFQAKPWVNVILVSLGAMAVQGSAIGWIRHHRRHHAYTDRPGDTHSPFQYAGFKGIAWSHQGWMWWDHPSPPAPASIETNSILLWQRKYYVWFIVATLAIPTLVGGLTGGIRGGIDGLFIAGFFRIVLQLNAAWSINSACHLWGRKISIVVLKQSVEPDSFIPVKKVASDGSRNNWLLAILTMGEGYHAMHHLFPEVAFHGWGKYDIDATKWLIIFLEWLGLVTAVQRPPRHQEVQTSPANELRLTEDSFLIRADVFSTAA
jgi:stearoyl-CoA desaturase (delta-9 desaturase)